MDHDSKSPTTGMNGNDCVPCGKQLGFLDRFLHFLVIVPLVGIIETPRPRPSSISQSVLDKTKGKSGDGGDGAPSAQAAE